MSRFLAAALASLLSLLAAAGDPAPEPVSALLEGLRSEDAARREACETELDRRWVEARDAMTAALAAEKDAEARARLERILGHGGPTIWADTTEEGLKQAAKLDWPCLVVRGDGTREEPATVEGVRLREALAAPGTVRSLRGYVAVWVAAKDVPGLENGKTKELAYTAEGHGGIEMYVVHPKRGICHYVRGWWKAERLSAELERGREFAKAADLKELRGLRAAAVEDLKKLPGADSCENVRRHLHPWNCSAEECTLKRLALCYRQGDALLGSELAQKLPDPIAGGESSDLRW